MFNCLVKPVLLYGSETWRMNATPISKVQTFVNSCLRKILQIHWPERITNEELWRRTSQRPMEEDIKMRKWKWIGHTLRKPKESITRQALTWNPQGKRKKGRPRKPWRRDVEKETQEMGFSWVEVSQLFQDRVAFRNNVIRGLFVLLMNKQVGISVMGMMMITRPSKCVFIDISFL